MKKRAIILLFMVALLFGGCASFYDNSLTVVNTVNTDNNGELDILANGQYIGSIYNSSELGLAKKDVLVVKMNAMFSNIAVGWNYDILAVGKKKGKTVAAHFPFYATSYSGGNHQTWVVTDAQLQPYGF